MTSPVPFILPQPEPAALEIRTADDVRHFVECRLRWYGLDKIVVQDIRRESASSIAVTLRDLGRNRTYRWSFTTTLIAPGTRAASARRIAA